MRKRLGIIILTIAVTASMLGCSGKESAKKKAAKEDSPEKIFQEAMEKLDKETNKAIETKSVTSYDDETEEEEYYTCIYDGKKNIVERISKDEDDTGTKASLP